MRLIDVDKLKPNAEWSDYYGEFRAYSITQVDDASTVEAIPIEWINEWVNNYCNSYEVNLIECLLKTWRNQKNEG